MRHCSDSFEFCFLFEIIALNIHAFCFPKIHKTSWPWSSAARHRTLNVCPLSTSDRGESRRDFLTAFSTFAVSRRPRSEVKLTFPNSPDDRFRTSLRRLGARTVLGCASSVVPSLSLSCAHTESVGCTLTMAGCPSRVRDHQRTALSVCGRVRLSGSGRVPNGPPGDGVEGPHGAVPRTVKLAPSNICDIFFTLDTFHLLSGWLKVESLNSFTIRSRSLLELVSARPVEWARART